MPFNSETSPYVEVTLLHKLGEALTLACATLSYRLSAIKRDYRRRIHQVVITLITIGVFLAAVLLPLAMFKATWGKGEVLASALVAIGLALGYPRLRPILQNLLDRLLTGKSYNYGQVLRDYDQRIADILDLERLSGVVIGIINEVLDIERGAILVTEGGDDGISIVRLKLYAGLGTTPHESMEFRGSNSVLIHLRLKGLPLTQRDLDSQSVFKKASQKERDWFAAMGMDAFVPIRAKERLVGVLAVGAKRSGKSLSGEELDFLSQVADQTSVALENARLFEDLTMLNTVLSQAYTALDKANRQLQEMDKLKSAFIGAVTHELRTPFANICFSLQLLDRYAQANLPPEPRHQLDELNAGVQSAKTMVDNLVTFAAFLSKQGELRLTWLDFGQVIQETLLPLETIAQVKGVELSIALPDDLPSVYGDGDRLADAVHHLTENAIKFTEAGGKVWIRYWARADTVHFEVRDTGVGMPADRLPTLWEGFTQMADPLCRGVEGLGLGLALVKYIVHAHGGQVWVHSEEGTGSTFGFQLPLGGPEHQDTSELARAMG